MELSEWTEAKELKSGDLTFTADGKLLAISSIEVDGREETVYNFEVEDFHTYFVGESGIWVHNDSYVIISPQSGPSHSSDSTKVESFVLIEDSETSVGLGLSVLAEKILKEKGEELTEESVRKQMDEIKKLNPDLFDKDKNPKQFLYEGDMIKVENEVGPAESTLLDDIPYVKIGSQIPKVIYRTLKWGGKALEKGIEKALKTKEYKEVSDADKENWNNLIQNDRSTIVRDNMNIFKALNINPEYNSSSQWINEKLPDWKIGNYSVKEELLRNARPQFSYSPEGNLIIKDKDRYIVTDKHMSRYNR